MIKGEERKDLEHRVGHKLRSAREARGDSLADVERTIKIHAHHLEALEQGDFEALPRRAWARGFLVMYANYLGLQASELVDQVFPPQRPSRPVHYVRRRWRGLVAALGVVATTAMAALALVIIAPYNPISEEIADALNRVVPGTFLEGGVQRFVILGFTDSKVIGGDNVLTAKVAQNGFGLLSIPGNTLTEVPGYGEREIGDALELGGPDLARQTAARLTRTEIQYYLVINPDGIKDVVNTIGGVRIDVPASVSGRSTPGGPVLALPQGTQTLDGDEALVYLQGNDLPDDVARAERQQNFLFVMFHQALAPGTLISSPATLGTLLDRTQTNMSAAEALQLASRVGALEDSGADMETDTLPGRKVAADSRRRTDAEENWIPNPRKLPAVLKKTMQ